MNERRHRDRKAIRSDVKRVLRRHGVRRFVLLTDAHGVTSNVEEDDARRMLMGAYMQYHGKRDT